jgi:hypothetical protein
MTRRLAAMSATVTAFAGAVLAVWFFADGQPLFGAFWVAFAVWFGVVAVVNVRQLRRG